MQVKLKTRCPYILHKWVNIVQLVITWSNYTTEKLLSYSMQCVAHQSKRQISIENGPKYCHNRILKVAQFGHTLCKLVLTCLRIEMTWKLVKSELGLGESKSLYFWLSLLWNPKNCLKERWPSLFSFHFVFLQGLTCWFRRCLCRWSFDLPMYLHLSQGWLSPSPWKSKNNDLRPIL